MKTLLFILLILGVRGKAQQTVCSFGSPAVTIDFGSGIVDDLNENASYAYRRIMGSCPSDGHYTYTNATSDCFRGDWQTLPSDHTGKGGNMMIVNASYRNGYFLTTRIQKLKPGTIYQFGVWMMNVCRLTEKCPFPLLPNITIQVRTLAGVVVGQFETGEVSRMIDPKWSQYKFEFTTPASQDDLVLTMIDNIPGGCGNDFVLDDITFAECIKIPPPKPIVKKNLVKKPVASAAGKTTTVSKKPPVSKPVVPKTADQKPPPGKSVVAKKPAPKPAVNPTADPTTKPATEPGTKPTTKATTKPTAAPLSESTVKVNPATVPPGTTADSMRSSVAVIADRPVVNERPRLAPPPAILVRRENEVYKTIQAPAGEIRIDLYDNGEIDGDTVTIYHNNKLVVSRARLSAQPITLRIAINPDEPYHEIVMVANNLGSIPPNTSLMVVNAAGTRYEVYTSSNEKKNAKVIFNLKP